MFGKSSLSIRIFRNLWLLCDVHDTDLTRTLQLSFLCAFYANCVVTGGVVGGKRDEYVVCFASPARCSRSDSVDSVNALGRNHLRAELMFVTARNKAKRSETKQNGAKQKRRRFHG